MLMLMHNKLRLVAWQSMTVAAWPAGACKGTSTVSGGTSALRTRVPRRLHTFRVRLKRDSIEARNSLACTVHSPYCCLKPACTVSRTQSATSLHTYFASRCFSLRRHVGRRQLAQPSALRATAQLYVDCRPAQPRASVIRL